MSSFPTVLPDQLVADDQRDQLARQAAALGDPTVGYQRHLLASQAARLGDPVAAPATSSSSATPDIGSGGDLAASPLATSAALGTADPGGTAATSDTTSVTPSVSTSGSAATSPLTAPSSVDDQRRELAWTAAQLGDPTAAATSPAAPTAAPSSGTGAPTSFSAPAAGPDLLKNGPDVIPGGAGAASTPPNASNVDSAPASPPAASVDVRPLRERNLISNQFDYQRSGELSPQEAMSACGPTAALAFARYFGRQPTIGEALGLAKQVGWTPSVGMAGPDSEVALLGRLGVDSRYQPGASAGDVAGEVQAGRPVILDTPNHYYAIDAFDAKSGLFHVGGSGQALRGGSDWMSWAQIAGHGNGVRGAIVVRGSGPGGASAGTGPVVESGAPVSSPAAPTSTAASAPATSSPASSLFGGFSLPAIGATGVEQSTRPSSTPGPRFGGLPADAGASVPSPSWDQGSAAASAGLAPLPDVNATGANAGLSSSEGIPQGIQAPSTGGLRLLPGDTPLSDAVGNAGKALLEQSQGNIDENRGAFALTNPTPGRRYTDEQLAQQVEIGGNAALSVFGEAGKLAGEAAAPLTGALRELLAPAKDTAPEIQSALRDFVGRRLQAIVDGQTWAMRAKDVLGSDDTAAAASRFEQTGHFSEAPTPPQAAFANDVQQFTRDTGDVGRAHGYIHGDVTQGGAVQGTLWGPQPDLAKPPAAYFPHVYTPELNAAQAQAHATGLSPTDFYSQSRDFPTLTDAIAAGKVPVDSVGGPLAHYAQHVAESQAAVQLVTDLRAAGSTAVRDLSAGDVLPPGWVRGNTVAPQFTSVAFSQPVADVLGNVLKPSGFAKYAFTRALTTGFGEAKQTLFSLSGFHTLTVLRQAYRANDPISAAKAIGQTVQNVLVPGSYARFRLANADAFSEAARNGVTGLSGGFSADLGGHVANPLLAAGVRSATGALGAGGAGYLSAKSEGKSDSDALGRAELYAGVGAIAGPTIGKLLTDGLWERAVPTLKVMTYQSARAATGDAAAAATFANQTFGGNNLAAIGRSRTVQDALRLTAMAPDWWEGWARQVGSATRPGALGNLSRSYWLRTAVVDGAFLLEGLNYAISALAAGTPPGAHSTNANDPGHQFQLETTGLYDRLGVGHANSRTGMAERTYADILGPIASMLNAVAGPSGPAGVGPFFRAHASLPLNEGIALGSGVDWRGQPIAAPGSDPYSAAAQQATYALSQAAPVGFSVGQGSAAREPLPVQIASTITGMRTSRAEGSTPPSIPRLPDSSQQILRAVGLSYKPQPLATSLRGAPMTLPEEERYAAAYVQEMDTLLHTLSDQGTFGRLTPVQRTAELGRVEQAARNVAEGTLLRQIGPAELRRRIDAKNAAEGAALTH